jgi:hypothetical protein
MMVQMPKLDSICSGVIFTSADLASLPSPLQATFCVNVPTGKSSALTGAENTTTTASAARHAGFILSLLGADAAR